MEKMKASFYRGAAEVLKDVEIKFEEVFDGQTNTRTWYGEFYLYQEPDFKSEYLQMELSDGRSAEVKVIIISFMRYFFITFRSLKELPETEPIPFSAQKIV